MRTYLDKDQPLSGVDERLRREWSGFDPEGVRDKLLEESPFDEERAVRFQVRPFDLRHAYVDATSHLWNRSRPLLVRAAEVASDFLLVRRRSPRALDGAAFLFSRCLVDQHTLHKDAYVIPLWLATANAAGEDGHAQLFEEPEDVSAEKWRPNLSERALDYLLGLGIEDAETNRDSAALLWLHVLAIGFSPLYLEENGDAVRSDWPRVPLPASEQALRDSARLGLGVAQLLDLDRAVVGVDAPPVAEHLQPVGAITRTDGGALNAGAGDLAVDVGWGIVQQRAVMPGAGRARERERTEAERATLSEEQQEMLGAQVLDVYLNENAYWSAVPAAAWDYKIGGFQVLRKWLSYREKRVLGRDLSATEARALTSIVRRLTELALLGPRLDANYIGVTDSPHQETLLAGS